MTEFDTEGGVISHALAKRIETVICFGFVIFMVLTAIFLGAVALAHPLAAGWTVFGFFLYLKFNRW